MIGKLVFFLLWLLFCLHQNVNANLNLRIEFPKSVNTSKIKIIFDNGLEQKFLSPTFINNRTLINESTPNPYTTVTILYSAKDESLFGMRLLVRSNVSSYIVFKEMNDTIKNRLSKYIFTNAIDVDHCKDFLNLTKYCKAESDSAIYYSNVYNLLHNELSLIAFNNSSQKLALKQLEYVKLYGKQYYFFWFFRINIVNELLKTHQLELYEIFNTAFPKKYRESYEGKNLKSLIEGNLFIKKGSPSPAFEALDYKGILISLKKLKGKYILLNFWASWCAPCVAEMPMLKNIRQDYSNEKLEIISVSYDRDSLAFIKGINSLKMNWTNLYSNNNLKNLFGNKPIPALYLIDSDGVIIFSSWEDEIKKLHEILATKLEK
jgi:thiol-disulfide isomerase/thioredoxin